MTAVKELNKHVSLNKSLLFIGVSKTRWYYSKSPRSKRADPVVTDVVRKIGKQRPTYGTRRMAAQVSRELNKSVNRKQIQRIFHKLGWIEPKKTKSNITSLQEHPPNIELGDRILISDFHVRF